MSQPAISSFVASRPTPSLSAKAGPKLVQRKAAARRALGNFDILSLPVRADQPGLNSVVVIDVVDAADLAQFILGRLHVAGRVMAAGLDQHLLALPVEIDVETGHRFIEHRAVDARFPPILAAVD